MRGFLLDTNVISELRKKVCDDNVVNNFVLIPFSECCVSSLTIYELAKGAELLRFREPLRAGKLDEFVRETLWEYQGRIISLTEEIAETAARMCPAQPLPYVDGFLAAPRKFTISASLLVM